MPKIAGSVFSRRKDFAIKWHLFPRLIRCTHIRGVRQATARSASNSTIRERNERVVLVWQHNSRLWYEDDHLHWHPRGFNEDDSSSKPSGTSRAGQLRGNFTLRRRHRIKIQIPRSSLQSVYCSLRLFFVLQVLYLLPEVKALVGWQR